MDGGVGGLLGCSSGGFGCRRVRESIGGCVEGCVGRREGAWVSGWYKLGGKESGWVACPVFVD